MKKKQILAATSLLTSLGALGVPAYTGILRQENPDGTRIDIRLHGDEHFSYATGAEDDFIYECGAEGFWAKAVRSGRQLQASHDEDMELLRNESEIFRARHGLAEYGPCKMATDNEGRSTFPTIGTDLKFLIVLLEYEGTPFTMEDPRAFYTRWFNEDNFIYQDITSTPRDYYRAASDGKFDPTFVVAPLVRLPKPSEYYTGGDKYTFFTEAIREAMKQLNESDFDFSPFDINHDDVLDNVYFIFSGYGQADTADPTTIWPHKSSVGSQQILAGRLLVDTYACSQELRGGGHYTSKDGILNGMGTFCHEFGHVFGLPDLYDTNYTAATEPYLPGDWTIMCNGPYLDDSKTPPTFSAYERWVCRWLEFEDLTTGVYSLDPLSEKNRACRLEVPSESEGSREYLIFESRSRTGFDSFLPAEGLVIWHLDFNAETWRLNEVNNNADHICCTLKVPYGESMATAAWPADNLYGSMILPGFKNEFTTFNTTDESFTPIISGIKHNPETRKSEFTYSTDLSDLYSDEVASVKTYKLPDNKPGMHIIWEEAPGAEKYAVTVCRYSTYGDIYIVDHYDDKIIEGLSCEVNETRSMMSQIHDLTIRAINADGLPSAKSTIIGSFKPNSLDELHSSAIENIENPENALGEEAASSPMETEVFNLHGEKIRHEKLSPGIYIIRTGAHIRKVTVR